MWLLGTTCPHVHVAINHLSPGADKSLAYRIRPGHAVTGAYVVEYCEIIIFRAFALPCLICFLVGYRIVLAVQEQLGFLSLSSTTTAIFTNIAL